MEDEDDTDPVATACAIVIPTVFVAVVLTIMWRNGTLARAFEKAMQGASEALKAGEEAVNNNNNNNTSNTNNNAPQPDVDELQREIEALKGEKARAEARALQREIEALKEEKARAEAIALRVGAPGTRTGAAQHYPTV
jgi:Tfp pilus assembly protein PilX